MLSDYIQEEQTKLFEEFGVFFAFGDDQFEEGAKKYAHLKPEGTKWAHLGAGMYMPSALVKEFNDKYEALTQKGIKKDLAENGRAKVLDRELANYEIGYSWEGHRDQNFRSAIDGYGFTEEEIETAYNKHMQENEY